MRIAFFASHNGSNMQAIIDACQAKQLNAIPALVISNNAKSGAIARAKKEKIAFYSFSAP